MMHKARRALISLTIALLLIGASAAYAQNQIQWQPYSLTWSSNVTFVNELHQSVRQFFGNAVGAYFEQSTVGTRKTVSQESWALISTQFLDPSDPVHFFNRGTILNGQWKIYAIRSQSGPLTAFVTPIDSTKIVAAAIVHLSCGSISEKAVHDRAAFEAQFRNPECESRRVTVFFKRKIDVNRKIRDVLVEFGTESYIKDCKQAKLWASERGYSAPGRCRVRWNVVVLNGPQ